MIMFIAHNHHLVVAATNTVYFPRLVMEKWRKNLVKILKYNEWSGENI